MGFYSFVVRNNTGDIVVVHEHFLAFDVGRNVFNTQVDDLRAFTEKLDGLGVKIITVNCLDVGTSDETPPWALPTGVE